MSSQMGGGRKAYRRTLMTADDYLGRVQAVAWEATSYLSPTSTAEVLRLIDHGEPAEAMCSLAWAVVKEGVRVPRRMIEAIRAYAAGIVDDGSMPPNLSDYALPASEEKAP